MSDGNEANAIQLKVTLSQLKLFGEVLIQDSNIGRSSTHLFPQIHQNYSYSVLWGRNTN